MNADRFRMMFDRYKMFFVWLLTVKNINIEDYSKLNHNERATLYRQYLDTLVN